MIDIHSSTWRYIEKRIKDTIEKHRDMLEDIPPDAIGHIAHSQGVIAAMRGILKAADDPIEMPPPTTEPPKPVDPASGY